MDKKIMIEKAKIDGIVEIQSGVYLYSQGGIISEQNEWADGDGMKSFDFTASPFWIMTDDGVGPMAIHGPDDIEIDD